MSSPSHTKSQVWKGIGLVLVVGCLALGLMYVLRLQATVDEHRNFSFSVVGIDRMEQALHRMEGANNGFLLTGSSTFREPFNHQRDILSSNYQELLKFTVDDALQQKRLKRFKAKLTQWFTLYNPLIVRRRTTADSTSVVRELSGTDQQTLLRCRLLSGELLALLDEMRATQEHKAHLWEKPNENWFFQIIPANVEAVPSD